MVAKVAVKKRDDPERKPGWTCQIFLNESHGNEDKMYKNDATSRGENFTLHARTRHLRSEFGVILTVRQVLAVEAELV